MEAARKLDEVWEDLVMVPKEDLWLTLKAAAELRLDRKGNPGTHRMAIQEEALDGKIRHQIVAGRRVYRRDDIERLNREDAERAAAPSAPPDAPAGPSTPAAGA